MCMQNDGKDQEVIRVMLGDAPISTKLCKSRLRWYGYVQREVNNALLRRTITIDCKIKVNLNVYHFYQKKVVRVDF